MAAVWKLFYIQLILVLVLEATLQNDEVDVKDAANLTDGDVSPRLPGQFKMTLATNKTGNRSYSNGTSYEQTVDDTHLLKHDDVVSTEKQDQNALTFQSERKSTLHLSNSRDDASSKTTKETSSVLSGQSFGTDETENDNSNKSSIQKDEAISEHEDSDDNYLGIHGGQSLNSTDLDNEDMHDFSDFNQLQGHLLHEVPRRTERRYRDFYEYLPQINTVNDTVIRQGCCEIVMSIKYANCTDCNLWTVPQYLPWGIEILLLSYNFINETALPEGIFANYRNLTHLWLDSNSISSLPNGVFEGLENLKFLNMYNNSITLNEEFRSSQAFFPLNDSLEFLVINRNSNDTHSKSSLVYPDAALSGLKHLQILYIDGLKEKSFGEGFLGLKKLTNLTLSGYDEGYCNIVSLSRETFRYLNFLLHLNISDCNLNGSRVDNDTFKPLFRLQSLDVSNNFNLGIQAVGEFMFSFKHNPHFRHLRLQRIGTRFAPCIIVYKHTLRHFKNSSLEIIEAMDNEIEMVQEGAIELLPPTLKVMNLTNNKISFGAYWRDMASLKGLERIHLDGYMHPNQFPLFFPAKHFNCKPPETDFEIDRSVGKKKCLCGEGTCSSKKEQFMMPVPPNLKQFTMHSNSLAYVANNISFCPNNNLLYVDLSNNMFQQLLGPITGLGKLLVLNLTSCFAEYIGEKFFDDFQKLEYLNLYQNLLGDCLNADLEGKVFDKLYSLKYLNVSFNNLYRLNKPAFASLVSLEVLDLSTNRLSHVNFTINQMRNLRMLDIHKNDISSMPQGVMDHIDSLLNQSKPFHLDMRQNPIYCDCENLHFLEWIVRSKVIGNNYTHYYCKYPIENQPAVEMPNGFEEEVIRLRRACATHAGLFFGVAGCTLLVVFLIIGLVAYRFRWTLRYWFHAAKMKVTSNPQPTNEEYDFDVFISYATEDEDFVLQEISPNLSARRHLRLMIHGEMFQAGRHIADNIYMAVRQCRKTLVLVTKSMLASHWCTYELQMARMESISTGRSVLVFLFLEEIPSSLLSIDVVAYIKTSTYISYPDNPQHREAFWDKLADDLRAS